MEGGNWKEYLISTIVWGSVILFFIIKITNPQPSVVSAKRRTSATVL